MKRVTIRCPYCGAKATLHPASYVHGAGAVRGRKLYVCDRYPVCDSYVAAHQKTGLPMGKLANGDLRHKRIVAHRAFNWMWESGLMTRPQAYKWMQAKLGLSKEQAHIANFGDYYCDQLIGICNEARVNNGVNAIKEVTCNGKALLPGNKATDACGNPSTYRQASHSQRDHRQ